MGKGNAKGRKKKMKRKGIHASISVRKKNLVHISQKCFNIISNKWLLYFSQFDTAPTSADAKSP